MSPEEKERFINDVINVVDGNNVTDCHLSDYHREVISCLEWLQYMYSVIHGGANPTYNELLGFAHDVLTSSYDIETESGVISVSLPLPKERTIADVKKDIKHEKNPMRLKQLNKELNKLYKENKKKGK